MESDYAGKLRDLRLTRLYYFVFLGGTGFILPFLNLFFVRRGLSGTQIGAVVASGSVVALMAGPFWASHNERWRNPRAMLQASLLCMALGYLLLSQQTLFWGIIALTVFRILISAGVGPLSDSLALSVTAAVQKGFGSVRVYASMGWVVFVLFGGWLVDQTSLQAGLIAGSVTTLLGAIILFPIGVHNFSAPKTHERPSFRVAIRRVLNHRAMIGVGSMIAITGIANSGVANFETVYLDTLGAEETLIGIAGMLGAVVEIPCMPWADRLVSRKGSYRLLLISMLMTAALRALVLLVPAVATIMLARALAGISFSFYVIALVRFIGEQVPPHETRTVLALYNVTLASLIGIVAPPLAGMAYDAFGARWLYAVAVVGYLLGWVSLRQANR
jgi:MFS family permease